MMFLSYKMSNRMMLACWYVNHLPLDCDVKNSIKYLLTYKHVLYVPSVDDIKHLIWKSQSRLWEYRISDHFSVKTCKCDHHIPKPVRFDHAFIGNRWLTLIYVDVNGDDITFRIARDGRSHDIQHCSTIVGHHEGQNDLKIYKNPLYIDV